MSNDERDDLPRDVFGELITVSDSSNALIDDLETGLSNISMSIASAGGGGSGLPFIGISKQGYWHYGVEGIKVDPNSTAAFNLRSLKHGFIAWVEGKPHDVMVPANQPLPAASSLPQVGGTWEQGVSVELVFVSGKDKGVHCIYKNNTDGARQGMAKFVEQVKRQVKADPKHIYPIVRLETSSYDHPRYGLITKPVFSIVGFTDGRSELKQPETTLELKSPAPAAVEAPSPETAGRRRRVV